MYIAKWHRGNAIKGDINTLQHVMCVMLHTMILEQKYRHLAVHIFFLTVCISIYILMKSIHIFILHEPIGSIWSVDDACYQGWHIHSVMIVLLMRHVLIG